MTENLFSYGSLQSRSVQLNTFGRTLEGSPDILTGYTLSFVKIKDEAVVAGSGMTHHRNLTYTGNPSDTISGMVFTISASELEQADKYEEADNYKRIRIQLHSGKPAWVYVSADDDI